MFKKISAAALAVIVVTAALCGCAAPAVKSGDIATLAQKGLDFTAKMTEMTSSEAYVNALSSSSEINDVLAKAKLTAAPKAIYSITIPDGKAKELLFEGADAELSAELDSFICGKLYAYVPSSLASQQGAASLAAISVASFSGCFVCEALTAPVLYFYQYDSGYSVMATFIPGDNGAVYGSAMFVPCDEALRAADGLDAVTAWFDEHFAGYGLSIAAVEMPKS